MQIELKPLSAIDPATIVELLTHPLVRRHMPLSDTEMTLDEARAWAAAKDAQWSEFGYGPWAFVVDGEFVGWGGLQNEGGDADLGLVLHPDHWGLGMALYDEIIRRAFGEMNLASVTVLLPLSRTRVKGVLRLGFVPDGEVELAGERFRRYRLWNKRLAAAPEA